MKSNLDLLKIFTDKVFNEHGIFFDAEEINTSIKNDLDSYNEFYLTPYANYLMCCAQIQIPKGADTSECQLSEQSEAKEIISIDNGSDDEHQG